MNKATSAKIEKLQAALKTVAALADTGTNEYREAFGHYSRVAPGWRVAEKMRDVAVDALSVCNK